MSDEPMKGEIKVRQVKTGPQAYIDVPTRSGSQPMPLNATKLCTELAAVFKKSPKGLEGTLVEFLFDKGQIQRVWTAGKTWDRGEQPPPVRPTAGDGGKGRPGAGGNKREPHRNNDWGGGQNRQAGSQNTGPDGKFENPYNFIPALPRDRDHAELGDAAPSGHHRFHPGCWSGRIRIELTTKTPLLVPDLGVEQPNGHKVFGLRLDEHRVPVLPPTTIKGPLRVAYEAITNSRMGILEAHDKLLALRMPASEGVKLVPCQVVAAANGALAARLLPGLSEFGLDGRPKGQGEDCLMYAAWLPRYRKYNSHMASATDKHERQQARRYPDNTLPSHGDLVYVRITRNPHRSGKFSFLSVEEIQRATPGLACPAGWSDGIVFISGRNIMNKHEERVFLVTPKARCLPIEDNHSRNWQRLIDDYRAIHRDELEDRRRKQIQPSDYLGHEPGKTGFSRHVYGIGEEQLRVDTLCYASIETNPSGIPVRLVQLYPVSITRMLFSKSPLTLLSDTLSPAVERSQLSPADRVFGWVNQKGNGSFKGQLRIGAVTCLDGAKAVKVLEQGQGIPLAILGQPKPAQARFYAASNERGNPLPPGGEKKEGYGPGGGLRGRKVYPHQSQAERAEYWMPAKDVTQPLPELLNGRRVYREWLSHGQEQTDQNRSITAWIEPGSRFAFDMEVTNLSDVELGALLWLLEELAAGYLRVGGGKPLGFGSVNLRITNLNLRDGAALAADYRAFSETQQAGRRIDDVQQAGLVIGAYKSEMIGALGETKAGFDNLTIVKAFRNASRGSNLPTHYPRTDSQHGPVGESYKWFVKNEASDRTRHEHHSLPALAEPDRGLWTLIENPPR